MGGEVVAQERQQIDLPQAGLGLGAADVDAAVGEVDVAPAQVAELVGAGAGEEQRGDDRPAVVGEPLSVRVELARRLQQGRICSAVSRCTGAAFAEPASAAGGGVLGMCPYSTATESTHCRASIVLLIDAGGRGRSARPPSLRMRLAALDRPPAASGLDLVGAVGIDGLDVDLGERPVAEVGQQVREARVHDPWVVRAHLALARGDEAGRRRRRGVASALWLAPLAWGVASGGSRCRGALRPGLLQLLLGALAGPPSVSRPRVRYWRWP